MAADDEDLPLKRPAAPKDLTPLSIDELKHYIAGLEAEIARARAAIAAKESHRSGVDSLFKR
jgi:uncharacterized small protein (DUF1192 family)